jgi:hypothetical protein
MHSHPYDLKHETLAVTVPVVNHGLKEAKETPHTPMH